MQLSTKNRIAETFLSLLKSKGIEEITVVEICKLSDISRDTFYYYFQDKYHLIGWIYALQKTTIMKKHFGKESWSCTICRVLKLIRSFSTFYRQGFADTAYHNLEKSMKDTTFEISKQEILKRTNTTELTEEMKFYIFFDSYGAVAMTKEWVQSGMAMPEEEFANLLANSMPPKMKVIWDTFCLQTAG